MKTTKLTPRLSWLLVCVPAAAVVAYGFPELQTPLFVLAALAILPLAGMLGEATEHVAEHTSQGIGGLLNATFGNAAELIIALMALRLGLHDVVKASLTGSIIGNILLVMGASFFAGGIKYRAQNFNPTAARAQATMLTLAAIGLIVPALFHYMSGAQPDAVKREGGLSLEISIVLILTYGASLLFSLVTHKQLFAGEGVGAEDREKPQGWSLKRALLTLAGSTVMVAWMSELLVGSVEHAAASFGMSSVFIGVIVVAVIGNAAEHSTAVLTARKNKMDLSFGIAIGSSIQIALFVAPAIVFASYAIGPRPMNLVFTPIEVVAVGLAVLIMEQISSDGESNWLEGVQLLSVYIIFALVFYFIPS
ncbi:MAG TPA: calcium/proton exchanger [Bacteroidota bacterium]|nr:calcium/proton exchanger [Bacteroidota bacterium]